MNSTIESVTSFDILTIIEGRSCLFTWFPGEDLYPWVVSDLPRRVCDLPDILTTDIGRTVSLITWFPGEDLNPWVVSDLHH